MIPLIPVNKRTMSMSENEITPGNSDRRDPDVELDSMNDLPEPQEKKSRWKPLLIWLIPLIALFNRAFVSDKSALVSWPDH